MEKRLDARVVCISMNKEEDKKIPKTHLYIENNNIYISDDMGQLFGFLSKIEEEIKTVFGFRDKVKELYDHYKDMVGCVSKMAKLLKENDINFEYKFKDEPISIIEKIKMEMPIRSQIIILFASLEVIYFLDLAYKKETVNDNELITSAMDSKNLKKFINSFLLTKENEFYKNNFSRFLKINSKMLRELRNSLTHFFSISGNMIIVQDHDSLKVKKTEELFKKNKMGNIAIISPNDLFELMKSAHHLLIKKWNNDFRNDPENFHRKIQFVIELSKTKGVYLINEKDVNL
jgi:hypothetical protein